MSYIRIIGRVAAIVGTVLVTLVMTIAASSPNSDVIAAVSPPWWNADRTFEAAASAGEVLQRGRLPSVLIIRGDSTGLAARLRDAGALFLLDSRVLGGCALRNSEISR